MKRPRFGTVWLATAVLLGLSALTGCSSSAPGSTATAALTPRPTASINGLPRGVAQATAVPTAVPNTPALRANVTIDQCEPTQNGATASGTVRNPTATSTTYTITVFFTTPAGTVLGYGQTRIHAPAGHAPAWRVDAELTPTSTIHCVLRGIG